MSKQPTKKKTGAKKKSSAEQPQPALEHRRIRFRRSHLSFILIIGVLTIIGALSYNYINAANQRQAERQLDTIGLSNKAAETHYFYTKQLKPLIDDTSKFEAAQTAANLEIADVAYIDNQIKQIETDLHQSKFHLASQSTLTLSKKLGGWQKSMSDQIAAAAAADNLSRLKLTGIQSLATPSARQFQVPILIYHKTPVDFEQQLIVLRQRGYTSITPSQLVAAWGGAGLPVKPVIITFDDGFADQMNAYALLVKYQTKATFYIIDGGPSSNWCIGASRRYNDPSQSASGCGDAYLNWDQIRQLDASGLITIGSHTIDHSDLPTLTADQQRHEIIDGKAELERELGHGVSDFAYPYGDYNATTIAIVKQAGFTTAVTTALGTLQSTDNRYNLTRIRSTNDLP